MPAATIPDITHQRPAPIDIELTLGLSPATASTVERPIPNQTMFRINCATKPMMAPAKTAPHEISLSMMVLTSSDAETRVV